MVAFWRQGTIPMVSTCKASVVMAAAMLTHAPFVIAGDCRFPALLHQHRNIAAIETLELEWSRAYLRGDTGFEECLLTADFTEIMRSGEVKHLPDELALAAKNRANPLPMGEIPKGTVLLHGNVAVAYGRSQSSSAGRSMRYADYYVWENGHWRVYFAQQTEMATNP
jgi:hypothetical protein